MLALAAAAACGTSSGAGRPEVISVFAAASLTDAFAEMEAAYEAANPDADVELNLGGSSSLRTQILSGAPADVFASAGAAVMDQVVAAGETRGRPVTFATNRLQIAVPKGNPAGVTELADLARSELFIGLCASEVPCGALADEVLAAAGIEPSIDSREPDVRALITKVALGELDAGLVYRTDILALGDQVDGIDPPEPVDGIDPPEPVDGIDPPEPVDGIDPPEPVDGIDPPEPVDGGGAAAAVPSPDGTGATEYRIAVLAGADNPDGGERFVSFVGSADGRRIMAANGFGRP